MSMLIELNGDKLSEEVSGLFRSLTRWENVSLSFRWLEISLSDTSEGYCEGTVAFPTGLHGWTLTLTNFAKTYTSKFGVDEAEMTRRLWGESFFDLTTTKWTSKNTDSATCKRGVGPMRRVRGENIDEMCRAILAPSKYDTLVNDDLSSSLSYDSSERQCEELAWRPPR
ncbi:hypothetical protein VNO77_19321 [Canavalia gladiata]|uniref:Uncharacterized protein n=1 Tax=Canavalia gladiata TaxID=3824 RepID=A0AAN9LM75_CANGL